MYSRNGAVLCMQLESMIWPIMFDLALVTVLVHTLGLKPAGSTPFYPLLPRSVELCTTPLDMIAAAAVNASTILVIAALFTYSFAILYRCYAIFLVHILAGVAFAIIPGFLVLWVALDGLDWPLACVCASNLGNGSAFFVMFKGEHQLAELLGTSALTIVSVSLSWPFLCLDELSLWVTLAFFMAWDLFAVKCFIGPFQVILIKQRSQIWMSKHCDFPAGLLYETYSGFNLGSGDFLFYGVIVGHTFMYGTALGITSGLGMLLGQSSNVIWSCAKQGDSVPALPLAITCGLGCYFVTRHLALPAIYETPYG